MAIYKEELHNPVIPLVSSLLSEGDIKCPSAFIFSALPQIIVDCSLCNKELNLGELKGIYAVIFQFTQYLTIPLLVH